MIPNLIGICGQMQSGKHTLAVALSCVLFEEYNVDAVVVPISEPIKRVAFAMGWGGVKDTNGRRLLQRIGDAGRECVSRDIWLAKWRWLCDEMRNEHGGEPVVIADDLRYDNEAQYIVDHGGIVIAALRSNIPPSGLSADCHDHKTEQWLINDDVMTAAIVTDGDSRVVLSRAERFLQDVHDAALDGFGEDEGLHGHLKRVLTAWRT